MLVMDQDRPQLGFQIPALPARKDLLAPLAQKERLVQLVHRGLPEQQAQAAQKDRRDPLVIRAPPVRLAQKE